MTKSSHSNVKSDTVEALRLAQAHYLVTFISLLPEGSPGYQKAADQMLASVEQQQGFIGSYSVRNEQGLGITNSYWKNLTAIEQWKNNKAHLSIQKKGKEDWYQWFQLQVCEIVRIGCN